jgi:hypothetical protein
MRCNVLSGFGLSVVSPKTPGRVEMAVRKTLSDQLKWGRGTYCFSMQGLARRSAFEDLNIHRLFFEDYESAIGQSSSVVSLSFVEFLHGSAWT